MIKRITDLSEMKRVIKVRDIIELDKDTLGIITIDPNDDTLYNVYFKEDNCYGDDLGIETLEELIESYYETWESVILIKEVDETKDIFSNSVNSKFIIDIKCDGCDYNKKVTLLNFNPMGSSVFLDNNNKIFIVETKNIKYMECIDK